MKKLEKSGENSVEQMKRIEVPLWGRGAHLAVANKVVVADTTHDVPLHFPR